MSQQHTPAPWQVSADSKALIETVDQENTTEFVASALNEADARRIVACVNACEGLDTEFLEMSSGNDSSVWDRAAIGRLRQQHDELLAALETLARSLPQIGCERAQMMDYANAAIAKEKGGAA